MYGPQSGTSLRTLTTHDDGNAVAFARGSPVVDSGVFLARTVVVLVSHSDRSVEALSSRTVPKKLVRSPSSRWVLLNGNRWLIAGVLASVVFVLFFVLGRSGVIGMETEDPSILLLSVYIAGNLTLVPIAITINQLVLSREFGKPHTFRERDDGVSQLRRDLKELADVSFIPPSPESFLRLLVETIEERTTAVDDVLATDHENETSFQAALFLEELDENTERVRRTLDRTDFGSYRLLDSMLRMNSAWLIGTAEYLQADAAESPPAEPFDRIEEVLRLFNVTRQYTKTLHAQKELATLSRLLLYTGFAALLVSALGMLVYATPLAGQFSGTSMVTAFSLVSAVVFTPLAFLTSYMLRLSTLMSYPPLENSFITDG